MLDQSFSAKNFRRIFDLQNRRGNFVEAEFFPDVKKITDKITDCNTDIRALRKQKTKLKPAVYSKKIRALYTKRDDHKEKKEHALTKELQKISEEVTTGKVGIELKKIVTPTKSVAYSVKNTPHAFFVLKQLQHNINRLYNVQQANRFEILCQLKSLLSNNFPKQIVRTDIKNFYESIPTARVLAHINKEPLLSISSKRVIHQIIRQYQRLSGSELGIPRGVGISAYLAELYTRQLDEFVKTDRTCFYFARYVDDIVVLYLRTQPKAKGLRLLALKKIARELNLRLNMEKTFVRNLPEDNNISFPYLGFDIKPDNKETQFEFTTNKLKKYNRRIYATFTEYRKQSKLNEKMARKLLVKRVRFLTGNTRLLNNKRDALVGIFFSNRLLNQYGALECLDTHLQHRISEIHSPTIRARLDNMSFVDGFEQRRFCRYTTDSLRDIVSAWKHET